MTSTNALFNAESMDLRGLIARDPLLVIPVYQRAFAWDDKHVYALIEDVLEGIQKIYSRERSYGHRTYIGTIIYTDGDKSLRDVGVQSDGHRSWLVIDGQQRFTTICILALSLAYRLSVINHELVSGILERNPEDPSIKTLKNELDQTISELISVVRLKGSQGLVPRIIRLAADDSTARFNSSLSYLLFSAIDAQSKATLHRFKARDPSGHKGKNHERKRFESIEKELGNFIYSSKESIFNSLPSFKLLEDRWQDTTNFLENRIPSNAFRSDQLRDEQVNSSLENTYRLCLFSRYLLSRLAMTTVHGYNEELAYDVFDSLNTSGEPLNAYETFKPYVLRQLNQRTPEYSAASSSFQLIESVAQIPKTISKRQKLYSSTAILYTLTELGERVGKKLSDQHSALRKCYDQSVVKQESLNILSSAIQVAAAFEEPEVALRQGQYLSAIDEEAKVCFKFLSDINHSISLPPIVRCLYEVSRGGLSPSDLSDTIKAVTAFAILWRAPRGGTAGIDSEFRSLMEGNSTNGVAPLARSKDTAMFTVNRLKLAIKNRLESARDASRYGPLFTRENWVNRVARQRLYDNNKKMTKLILLAAQHDATPDLSAPGLIVTSTPGFAASFTLAMYISEQTYSIEHVAPQNDRSQYGWSSSFDAVEDCVHWIGNLLLMPLHSNSLLHNRSWDVKRKIYRALSRPTKDERRQLLDDPALRFLHPTSQQQILDAPYMAPLDAVSRINEDWNLDFVKRRSERLLQLAYDKFEGWLKPT